MVTLGGRRGLKSEHDVRPRGLLVQPQNQNIQGSERGDVQHSASGAVQNIELQITKKISTVFQARKGR